MTEGRTVGLAEALAGLVEVGVAHGVDEASVRAEGEALAATVAEVPRCARGLGAHHRRRPGGPRTSWRRPPADVGGGRGRHPCSELVAGRSPGAAAYAKALGDVCVVPPTSGADPADGGQCDDRRGRATHRPQQPSTPLRPRVPSPWARAARTHGK